MGLNFRTASLANLVTSQYLLLNLHDLQYFANMKAVASSYLVDAHLQ